MNTASSDISCLNGIQSDASSSPALASSRRGVDEKVIDTLQNAGIDLDHWLQGFEDVRDGVRSSVKVIKSHPLLPREILVHGLLIAPDTGKLELVEPQ